MLPRFLVEIVQGSRLSLDQEKEKPLAIVLLDPAKREEELRSEEEDQLRPTDRLLVVSRLAEKAGVRPGQTVTEALALLADLRVEALEMEVVQTRLRAIAEVASSYGTVVCWQAPDTVWVNTSGCAHLFGGEQSLAEQLQEQVRFLGHVARVVIADGPKVAQAVGRFGESRSTTLVNDPEAAMSELPLTALGLDEERLQFLGKLGLFLVGQLSSLPAKTASARLGPRLYPS